MHPVPTLSDLKIKITSYDIVTFHLPLDLCDLDTVTLSSMSVTLRNQI